MEQEEISRIGVLPRQPDFDVIGLLRAETHVAGAKRHHPVGKIELLENFLRRIGHALMFGFGLVGRGDRDQFHLGELVHADHAAGVLARRARLGAETGRESGEAQRQFGFVENFVGDIVGQRHFGGGDEPTDTSSAVKCRSMLRQFANTSTSIPRQLSLPFGSAIASKEFNVAGLDHASSNSARRQFLMAL